MTSQGGFRGNWARPLLFLGNNPISLIGGALTTASAMILIGFWVVDVVAHSGPASPYVGIIIDLCLPGLFVLGLILIPVGILLRRRRLKATGQLPAEYPKVDFGNPVFRRGLDFVVIATFINFVIVGTASYRGVAYMDTPNFCGQSCHVMHPEWAAYNVSQHHTHVACTECHIPSGAAGFVNAKINGTKQLLGVVFDRYPRPIMPDNRVPAAAKTCLHCHNPQQNIGDKLIVSMSYGDDEKNSVTHSLLLIHVGGRNMRGSLSGIHGAHLGRIEYIATDTTNQTIPWVAKENADGSMTEYQSSDVKGPVAGQKRLMDCIDCHNRAAHSFDTPEDALNQAMAAGNPDAALPFVHKEGLSLLKATYATQADAQSKITAGLEDFYRAQHPDAWSQQRAKIDQAAKALVAISDANVFPSMKVTWGTHPNNIGHNAYPGCYRCHDGNHNTADGKKSITQDCTVCHNLVAIDEANPKQLADLGMQ